MRHTQIRTHAHTHAARRGRRTEVRTPDAAPAPAGGAFENPDGDERPARALRVLRALRAARARYASESRGALKGEARLTGSDGAPLGGSERGGARGVTSAATPPSESRTEARGVAQPAPFPADRSFGRSGGGQRPRADGAGRRSEYGSGLRGRPGALCARSARRARRPLVIVPYLINCRTESHRAGFVLHRKCEGDFPSRQSDQKRERHWSNGAYRHGRGKHLTYSHTSPNLSRAQCLEWELRGALLGVTFDCDSLRHVARRHGPALPQLQAKRCPLSENSSELPQLLTVTQVGQRLCVCRRTVERLIATSQLRACKIGRSTRIATTELARYITSIQRWPSKGGAL